MKKRKFKGAKALLTLLAMLIPIINVSNVNAEDTYIYDGEYTIESMIKNYNIITLGQREPSDIITGYQDGDPYGLLNSVVHIAGPILAQGNLGTINSSISHSQRVNGVSSFIKGKILASGYSGGDDSDGTNPKFYVGTENEVEKQYSSYHINGFPWYTTYETIKTENYIDFKKLYDSVVAQQKKLDKGTVVTPDSSGTITLELGETYTIESLDNVMRVNFTNYNNSDAQKKTTLINITDAGNDNGAIKFPELLGNGVQVSSTHYIGLDNGPYLGNVVWNIPNAKQITQNYNVPLVGHIIAPNADVKFFNSMNFAGCILVNSIDGVPGVEAHYYPFQNDSLPSTTSDESGEDNMGDSDNDNTGESDMDNETNNDNNEDSNTDNEEEADNDSIIGGDDEEKDESTGDFEAEADSIVGGDEVENPNTFDNVTIFGLILLGSLVTIVALGSVFTKLNKQNS